jgi:hypothetical protein
MNLKAITIIGMIILVIGIVTGVMFFGYIKGEGTWTNYTIKIENNKMINPELSKLIEGNVSKKLSGLGNTRFEIVNSSGTEMAGIDHYGSMKLLGNLSIRNYLEFLNSTNDLQGYIDKNGNLAMGGLISSFAGLYTDNGIQAKGFIECEHNISIAGSGYFKGDGSLLTGIPQYQFLNNNFNGSGNITAGFFIGNGSLLTGITAGNSSFNQSLTDGLYAKYNFTNNNFNGSGNFTTTGNIIVNGLRTSGQVWINDTLGRAANMGNLLLHLEEMSTDTLLDKSRSTLSCTGGVLNYTLIALDGVGDWNFNATIYAGPGVSVANATVSLTCGTDITPITNYVYFELVANVPTLKTASTYPSTNHIDVATFVVGDCSGSSYTIYAYSRNRYEVDSFVKRVIERFEESGTLYVSGFTPYANTTSINVTSGGEFFNGIFEMTSTNIVSVPQGFYYINSTGNFVQATSLSAFTQYADGTAMTGANLRVNIIWGLVPINTTGGVGPTQMRLVAVLPNVPTAAYSNVNDAIADIYETANFFPPNAEVKNVFVPIARTIVRPNTDVFEPFSTGKYYQDIRGKVTSGGSAATSSDLTGLVPYTGATTNVDLGIYNITAGSVLLSGNQNMSTNNITTVDCILFKSGGKICDSP